MMNWSLSLILLLFLLISNYTECFSLVQFHSQGKMKTHLFPQQQQRYQYKSCYPLLPPLVTLAQTSGYNKCDDNDQVDDELEPRQGIPVLWQPSKSRRHVFLSAFMLCATTTLPKSSRAAQETTKSPPVTNPIQSNPIKPIDCEQKVPKRPDVSKPSASTSTTTTTIITPNNKDKVIEPILEPINLTRVVEENNINVTLICQESSLKVDRKSFTKVRYKNNQNKWWSWLPSWWPQPKPMIVKEFTDINVFSAGILAGAMMEVARTTLLYPLTTIKTRIQVTNDNDNVGSNNNMGNNTLLVLSANAQTGNQTVKEGAETEGIMATLPVQGDEDLILESISTPSEVTGPTTQYQQEMRQQLNYSDPVGEAANSEPTKQLKTTTITRSMKATNGILGQRISVLKRQLQRGNLYAGFTPALLISLPATGVFFGARDVTKRALTRLWETQGHNWMTMLTTKTTSGTMATVTTAATTATTAIAKWETVWIAVLAILVADIAALIVRTPVETLSLRLQAAKNDVNNDKDDQEQAGAWFSESIARLPAVILTDLPYLLSKTFVNGYVVSGQENIGRYGILVVTTACVCALLTTPFDVARTRILVDSDGDPTNGLDGGSRDLGVIETLTSVVKEGDAKNLFRGWFERVLYLGIGRAWFDPIASILYVGVRDLILLEWF